MAGKTPRWESELWHILSTGDGMHCPLYDRCHIRQRSSWCLDDNREDVNWLLDTGFPTNSSFDFIESGACYGEFKTVEMLAERYLREGGIVSPPVPAELIMQADKQHPIEIRLVPVKTCHGAIWRLKNIWVIQLKEDDTPNMRRFTLFHEAFHILAHRNTAPVFKKRGAEVGAFNELLADFFAVCVLMPKEWVKERWTEVHELDQMVGIFGAPKSAMYMRLKRLALM